MEAQVASQKLDNFRVQELKEILRTLGGRVSGRKQDLIDRIRGFLEKPSTSKDAVNAINREQPRNPSLQSYRRNMPSSSFPSAETYLPSSRSISALKLVDCPFLDKQQKLLELKPMDTGTPGRSGHDSRIFFFRLLTSHQQLLGAQFRIFLRCANQPKQGSGKTICKDFFPRNGKWSIDGIALPHVAGTSKPVDITPFCSSSNPVKRIEAIKTTKDTYTFDTSVIEVVMAQKRSVYDLHTIVPHLTLEQGKRFVQSKLRPAQSSIDEDDVVAEPVTQVKLTCPMSMVRMNSPGRSKKCQHIQCFDIEVFLKMNERKPSWLCPVCQQLLNFTDLIIDDFTVALLARASEDVSEVTLRDNGEFEVQRDGPALKRQKMEEIPLHEEDDDDYETRSENSGASTPNPFTGHHPSAPKVPDLNLPGPVGSIPSLNFSQQPQYYNSNPFSSYEHDIETGSAAFQQLGQIQQSTPFDMSYAPPMHHMYPPSHEMHHAIYRPQPRHGLPTQSQPQYFNDPFSLDDLNDIGTADAPICLD